jgi:hypothetical protein
MRAAILRRRIRRNFQAESGELHQDQTLRAGIGGEATG